MFAFLFLAPVALVCAGYVLVTYLLLRLTAWSGLQALTIAIGVISVGLMIYSIGQTVIGCAAEPVYTPPACANANLCGEGMMTFPCDGPGGLLSYGFSYLFGPLAALLSAILTIRTVRRLRRPSIEA
jgi:hypothetical protein